MKTLKIHSAKICNFCLRPTTKYYQLEDCVKPPQHTQFDDSIQLYGVLKNILVRETGFKESGNLCSRCNAEFEQIYTSMSHFSKNILPPISQAVVRIKKLKTVTNKQHIPVSNKLTRHQSHEHSVGEKPFTSSCRDSCLTQATIKTEKEAMMAVDIKGEPNFDIYGTSEYSSLEHDRDGSSNESSPKDTQISFDLNRDKVKNEILSDNQTSNSNPLQARKVFECDQCSSKYLSQFGLGYHKRKYHSEPRKVLKESHELFKCDYCCSIFMSRKCLTAHLNTHSGISFTCHVCRRKYLSSKILREHLAKVHAERKFICEKCDREFKRLGNFKRHQLLHTKEMFMCDLCMATFSAEILLTEHSKTHCYLDNSYRSVQLVKFKPYNNSTDILEIRKCDNLRTYQRQVRVEKNFKCDSCGEEFNQLGKFRCHQLVHAGNDLKCS